VEFCVISSSNSKLISWWRLLVGGERESVTRAVVLISNFTAVSVKNRCKWCAAKEVFWDSEIARISCEQNLFGLNSELQSQC
jgi:hypothetical protein